MSGEPLDKLSLEAISFCQMLGSQAVTVSDILKTRDPVVYTAIQYGIDIVNQQAVSDSHRIRKWIILEKDFSIQGGELGESLGLGPRHLGLGLTLPWGLGLRDQLGHKDTLPSPTLPLHQGRHLPALGVPFLPWGWGTSQPLEHSLLLSRTRNQIPTAKLGSSQSSVISTPGD